MRVTTCHAQKPEDMGFLCPRDLNPETRAFPGFAHEYAGLGEIPELGISCGDGSGRGPAPVKRLVGYRIREPPGTGP